MRKMAKMLVTGCLLVSMSMAVSASESSVSENSVSESSEAASSVSENSEVESTASEEPEKLKIGIGGFSFLEEPEFKDLKGYFLCSPEGSLDDDHHVYATSFLYFALPNEEADKLLYSEDPSEEEIKRVTDAEEVVRIVVASEVDPEATASVVDDILGLYYGVTFDQAEEIGAADGYTFYSLPSNKREDFLSTVDEEYGEDYKRVEEALIRSLQGSDYYAPEDAIKTMAGQKLEFTATDLDGNTFTSEELFSENEITMINCWGTWCHNCVDEMADLAEIHTRLQEKNCGVVGMEREDDGEWPEETVELAKEKLKEWGTNYPNVIMPKDLIEKIGAYPTTIFVDKEGTVLCMPVTGARVDEYESIVDSLLSGEEVVVEAEEQAEPEMTVTYRVTVTDEDGPVEEAVVQFCDDTSCRYKETDEDGVAVFEVTAGKYEVHIAEVPDGYEEDETLYYTTDGSNEVNIQLKKQA